MSDKGTLFGLGVGPGDPELLTLRAWRLISNCQVIAYPRSQRRRQPGPPHLRPVHP